MIGGERVDQTRARGVQANAERGDDIGISRHAGAETLARLLHFLLGERLPLARRVHLLARRRDVEKRAAHIDGDLLPEIAATDVDVARDRFLLLRLPSTPAAFEDRAR